MPPLDKIFKGIFFLTAGLLLLLFPKATPWIGGILLALGSVTLLSLLWIHSYTVYLGDHSFSLNQRVIAKNLNYYWKERFPKKKVSVDFHPNSLTVSATMPTLTNEEREKVENELKHHLTKTLGYPHPVLLKMHETPY